MSIPFFSYHSHTNTAIHESDEEQHERKDDILRKLALLTRLADWQRRHGLAAEDVNGEIAELAASLCPAVHAKTPSLPSIRMRGWAERTGFPSGAFTRR